MKEIAEDTYQVLASNSEGEYKEKGSKFLAYGYPVQSIEEVEIALEEVRALHPKARHHCYAYRIGLGGKLFRANDDGEPSGTAGKPILGQLLSQDVSDTLVVVVRYFGGTKLGASGLIHAYKTATYDALNEGKKKKRTLSDQFKIDFDYSEMGHILNVIKSMQLDITEKVFDAAPYLIIEIPMSQSYSKMIQLKARLLQITEDQINDDTSLPFCQINKIESL